MPLADLEKLRAGALPGCQHLDLSGCDLIELPREVFDLAGTLESLDLSGNRLTALPADFARLTGLRRLFASRNPFDVLPAVLGECPALSQIGFRGCGLRELPAEALPPSVRWLTLTDNALETVPPRLGEMAGLQKLMLAGNRLRTLPETLAGASRLELLRIAANEFETLPPWLVEMPALSWLAFAGNPCETRGAVSEMLAIDWDELQLGPAIGEGASGRVYPVRWTRRPDDALALKLFKGTMTSDGLPDCERAAGLAAGLHPNLVGALGTLVNHPAGERGLVMPLMPTGWRPLAGPPDAESCSRDVYPARLKLGTDVALRIARGVAAAAIHLHERGLMHGDLYAHNILWDGSSGDARLSDFGGASFLAGQNAKLDRLEVRAWGLLLGELLDLCDDVPTSARAVRDSCTAASPASRPSMAEALDALAVAKG